MRGADRTRSTPAAARGRQRPSRVRVRGARSYCLRDRTIPDSTRRQPGIFTVTPAQRMHAGMPTRRVVGTRLRAPLRQAPGSCACWRRPPASRGGGAPARRARRASRGRPRAAQEASTYARPAQTPRATLGAGADACGSRAPGASQAATRAVPIRSANSRNPAASSRAASLRTSDIGRPRRTASCKTVRLGSAGDHTRSDPK